MTKPPIGKPIAIATLVSGTLDILFAMILTLWFGRQIPNMLRFVASGPFPAATDMGTGGAVLGIPAITTLHRILAHDPTASGGIVGREVGILLVTGLLLWIVTKEEKLPLSSVGLRTDRLGRSLAWGVGLAVVCLAAAVGCLA